MSRDCLKLKLQLYYTLEWSSSPCWRHINLTSKSSCRRQFFITAIFCCICHLHYIFACICQNGRFMCLLKKESQWWCLWQLATSLPQTHRLLVNHLRIKLFHSFPFSVSLAHFILDHKQRGSGLSSAKLEPLFLWDLRGLNNFHFECVLLASNKELFRHLNHLPHWLFTFFS